MRIGFDCAKLAKGTGKSIGIYNVAKSVVENLVTVMPEEHQLVVFGNEYNREDFDIEGVEFILSDLNINDKKDVLMWELFRVNKYIKKYNIDKIVYPRGFTSFFCPVEDIIIVHDLIPFYYDKHYKGTLGRAENAYIMYRLKQSIKSAKKVITISEYSKSDIINIVPKAASKIKVIYHGFDRRRDKFASIPSDYDYIFGVTSGLPHKNAKGIVKAYEAYCNKVKKPVKLVLAGIKSLEDAGIEVDQSIAGNIICQKGMSDAQYYGTFRSSKLLLFLPYIEGFGLPPLEAMELGVPVIASNRTSVPEVVDDAGILVDPDDYEAASEGIIKILEDVEYKKDLIFNGYVNLNNFRWEEKIQEYLKFILE